MMENNQKRILEKGFCFSYSSLNKLVNHPQLFYKEYILKEKEIKTEKYLVEGAIIHNLLLEPDAFDDKFITTPELPSPNSIKVVTHIHKLYEERLNLSSNPLAGEQIKTKSSLADFEDEILDYLEEINLHQKVSKEKRALKIIEPKSIDYFEHLKNSKDKTIIDSEVLAKCVDAIEIIRQDKGIMDLLGQGEESEGKAVFNELEIIEEEIILKGIVDNIVIDKKNKEIVINDFKTTSKTLSDFENTVEFYNYNLQAAIYEILVSTWCSELIEDSEEYSVKFNFIVFDKYNYLYAFPVTEETMARWREDLSKALEKAMYHIKNKNYNLPYEYITGLVKL